MIKVILVVGARPNFIKVAPIYFEMTKFPEQFQPILVHTGQHYDKKMSKVFLEDLALPKPDIYLGVGSGSHAEQTAGIMIEFEKVLEKEDPDLVVVVGDVNSTFACALTTTKYRCTKPQEQDRPCLAHVEAGLRSFDLTMPEEINRLLTDAIADILFTTEPSAEVNLLKEGVQKNKIHFVGNIMIDSLIKYRDKAQNSEVFKLFNFLDPQHSSPYVLVTLHRPCNVDDAGNFERIITALDRIGEKTPVIFPAHPRTQKRILEFNIKPHHVVLTEPLGYLDFLFLMTHAALVITDSGGIQEETTFLGIPCLTIRPNTERPITIEQGSNRLISTDTDEILQAAGTALSGIVKDSTRPELWDGSTAKRIVQVLSRIYG